MAYAKGEGSCRVLAKRFGVSFSTVHARCAREKWRSRKEQIVTKVEQKVESELVDEATAWVKLMKQDCIADRQRIEQSYEQLQPASDPVAVRCLTQSRNTVDSTMRRSLGLPLGDSGRMKVESDGKGGVTVVYDAGNSAL